MKNNLIIILTSIFIFVVIWIGFNLYHNSIASTISESESMQISPIQPSFDISVIGKLKKRENVAPEFQLNTTTQPPTQSNSLVTIVSSGSAKQASGGGLLQ